MSSLNSSSNLMPSIKLEKVVSLAKRRGFIYPSSEIYGGISGFWDYGPLGVALKNNIKRESVSYTHLTLPTNREV